ncbi:PcfJ domain-containing protein [Yersinia pseudotuberculosis]|uniref:PcfJ domain-containing protein n=1 Tax=Yersinia pseudotuberculosis TaxID=633 RepID=UPI001E3229CE|nr:PcfJ domain-containing protein [Yersinia pseudotuberculosis]MCE4113212.1 PcfJ domain-containing protein [Yersinia pseudotuberculosis]UFA64050.1 PcfJ domain-containing protein [Yersinia pseudotuberculosis]WLF06018.1 PcfJ domain-containing protein [Yersinia pseudotuberculosis]
MSLVIEEKIKYSRRSTNIIKNKNFFSTMMTLIKNSLFSKLSVALRLKILTIFERNCTRWVREFHENDLPSLERIILKWLEYHKDLYKNIKYKNSKERWETETNYLDHALEWVIVVKPLIHKNQTWDSFHKLAVAWSLEINNYKYSSYPTEWMPINIKPEKISDTYQIVEITNSEGLNKEGAEMLHCVYSYWGLCASGRYRVFSIFNEEERATLGLSIKKGGEKYILDQVRGMSNEAVSSNVKKVSKAILISVNAMCV